VKALAGVGLGVAGLALAGSVAGVAGVHGLLSLVPTWTNGPSLLGALSGGATGGSSGNLSLPLGL